jgi:HD-like signal output (HDOD) protein
MRELASLVDLDPEDTFLLGLMHDIGNVIVLRTAYEQEQLSHQWLDPDAFEFICFETHQMFGEIIAQQWQLPEDLTALLSSHHTFPAPDDPLRRQRLMIILTDMISQMLGHAPAAAYDLMNARAVAELGLAGSKRLEECLLALPKRIEETFESFE